ncbi:uncharacterized bolA-like protein C8C9.11 [Varroa jacobsoni]|uniref:uncharacterized bolA-like protein C8C9.11 n=1 Tax=Varroa jacobsoni TaxID=62625 RepID=UPI000BF92F6C|nr:uncharacterized bolA-like protein C8C9.11 [Varroa jacobsoni]
MQPPRIWLESALFVFPLPGGAATTMNTTIRHLFQQLTFSFVQTSRRHPLQTVFAPPYRNIGTMGVPAAHIEAKLKEKLECTHVELTDLSDGCGQKFAAVIVSPKFVGKNLLAQQRLVNSVLADELQQIHAFTQKTFTPEAWQKATGK